MYSVIFLLPAVGFWALFRYAFHKDRSRYRNCYLLFLALLGTVPFVLSLFGDNMGSAVLFLITAVLIALLIVPFFLIHNGVVMIRREGRQAAHLLSLALGIAVLIGEAATAALVIRYSTTFDLNEQFWRSGWFVAGSLVSVTVIYGSMAFLIFMIYTVFLQIIPRKRDFDYVIIHGAGLLHGDQLSKLLRDRVDKAIQGYRKDPTPPKLIPSGGKGGDETISEAEAMRRYLLQQGIPEADILMEDQSATTLENLRFSAALMEREGLSGPVLIVTNGFHVYRALKMAKDVGLPAEGLAAESDGPSMPFALLREAMALVKYALVGSRS